MAVVDFPTIRAAASAAAEVMQTGIPVAAMEVMDEVQMRVVNLSGATAPKTWKEVPTLFFKFAGTKGGVKEDISRVQSITRRNKGGNFEFASPKARVDLVGTFDVIAPRLSLLTTIIVLRAPAGMSRSLVLGARILLIDCAALRRQWAVYS